MINKKLSSYYGFIANKSPNLYLFIIFLGVFTGAAYAFLFPVIFYSFVPQDFLVPQLDGQTNYNFFNSPNSNIAILFMINCAVIYCSKLISNISVSYLEQKATLELKNNLYETISNASSFDIERIGTEKLTLALDADVSNAVAGSLTIPAMITSFVTVVGLLSYLAYLNSNVFSLVIVFVVLGIAIYRVLVKFAQNYFRRSRETYDSLQESVAALISGAKELKVNSGKRKLLFSEGLDANQTLSSTQYLKGRIIYFCASGVTDIMLFAIIGIAAFHLSYVYFIDLNSQIGIVMVLLYLTGPIVNLVNSAYVFFSGKVSFNKILALVAKLPGEGINANATPLREWNTLSLHNVSYAYEGDNGESFKVDRIDLTLKKGEVVYLVGGNGSGKSTLAKLITMHHFASSGYLMLGETKINKDNVEAARQHVGIVFTDFFLFKKIYGYKEQYKSVVERYLKFFCLDHKVTVNDSGEFSTLALSDGQRKRLALLAAILEDKDIYVFDEWAADQDPQFKKIFYEKIIPELQQKNKIILLITHDDSYFHLADRVIHMDYGVITSVEFPGAIAANLLKLEHSAYTAEPIA
ncbi:cyclic peptide export ABC transporter [Cellvibrio mixtus]|uniref:cyclic peptide export ABC transporter n=1 Tax=Cellvibrio mixtus TaxID=39650 RepID=UPI0006939009|nr:cyclic peptide export ABC transporter [Cellvibrio mixtus]